MLNPKSIEKAQQTPQLVSAVTSKDTNTGQKKNFKHSRFTHQKKRLKSLVIKQKSVLQNFEKCLSYGQKPSKN